MMAHTNIAEFENGRRVFRITNERFADTPVSPVLCSNFIEVGFGWQVEAMWSEMFYNRSFEKPCPFTPAAYHWYGGIVRFMCFNNLCNTTGQSCIEVDKEGYILPMCGQIFERMSRTEAAWALKIDGYEPDSLKSVEIQAAWNHDESKLVLYLLNKCDQDTSVTFDLSGLGRAFSRRFSARMSAESGAVQETMKSQGNVHVDYQYAPVADGVPVTCSIPAFSFTEIVME